MLRILSKCLCIFNAFTYYPFPTQIVPSNGLLSKYVQTHCQFLGYVRANPEHAPHSVQQNSKREISHAKCATHGQREPIEKQHFLTFSVDGTERENTDVRR